MILPIDFVHIFLILFCHDDCSRQVVNFDKNRVLSGADDGSLHLWHLGRSSNASVAQLPSFGRSASSSIDIPQLVSASGPLAPRKTARPSECSAATQTRRAFVETSRGCWMLDDVGFGCGFDGFNLRLARSTTSQWTCRRLLPRNGLAAVFLI